MKDEFVKIENKKLPYDKFKDIDFLEENNSRLGYTNILFLIGIISTFFMWILIFTLGR